MNLLTRQSICVFLLFDRFLTARIYNHASPDFSIAKKVSDLLPGLGTERTNAEFSPISRTTAITSNWTSFDFESRVEYNIFLMKLYHREVYLFRFAPYFVLWRKRASPKLKKITIQIHRGWSTQLLRDLNVKYGFRNFFLIIWNFHFENCGHNKMRNTLSIRKCGRLNASV